MFDFCSGVTGVVREAVVEKWGKFDKSGKKWGI